MDPVEIEFLKGLTPNKFVAPSSKAKPISLDINGHIVEIPEWSQLHYAENTLVKLILVVRFHKKIVQIWKILGSVQKTPSLKRTYIIAGVIMRCLTVCCGNDLIKFHNEQSKNPFPMRRFACTS